LTRRYGPPDARNDLAWSGSAGVIGSPVASFEVYRGGLTETDTIDCSNVKLHRAAVSDFFNGQRVALYREGVVEYPVGGRGQHQPDQP